MPLNIGNPTVICSLLLVGKKGIHHWEGLAIRDDVDGKVLIEQTWTCFEKWHFRYRTLLLSSACLPRNF